MRLTLLRHPATRAPPGLCYGRYEPGLAVPASHSAKHCTLPEPQPTRIVSSPQPRCQDFAAALAARWMIGVERDARWQELDFGDWEGLSFDTLPRAEIDRWAESPWKFQPPGGEPIVALVARVCAALNDLLADSSPDNTVLVVSHAGPIRAALGLLRGAPQHRWLAQPVPFATPITVACHDRVALP
jgi:alpha-ribazole phosphatase